MIYFMQMEELTVVRKAKQLTTHVGWVLSTASAEAHN